jgi:hypothetical protein
MSEDENLLREKCPYCKSTIPRSDIQRLRNASTKKIFCQFCGNIIDKDKMNFQKKKISLQPKPRIPSSQIDEKKDGESHGTFWKIICITLAIFIMLPMVLADNPIAIIFHLDYIIPVGLILLAIVCCGISFYMTNMQL